MAYTDIHLQPLSSGNATVPNTPPALPSSPYSSYFSSPYQNNAGYGNVYKDMQVCKMKANCNPKIWFGNVNTTCTRNKILYANRSSCDIMKHHVDDVLNNRLGKYIESWTKDDYVSRYKIKTD